MNERNVATLTEFLSAIQDFSANAPGAPLWYRGGARASHALIPRLYRHPEARTIEDLMRLEDEMLVRFRQRAVPYQASMPSDSWPCLFLMQHFGVPTRLLDWTENPFMALYFATTALNRRNTDGNGKDESAAVWVLNANTWNKSALAHISYSGGPLDVNSTQAGGFTPGTRPNELVKNPIAVYGAHNSARIVAQRGVFTVFGQTTTAMEVQYAESAFDEHLSLPRFPGVFGCRRHHAASVSAVGLLS